LENTVSPLQAVENLSVIRQTQVSRDNFFGIARISNLDCYKLIAETPQGATQVRDVKIDFFPRFRRSRSASISHCSVASWQDRMQNYRLPLIDFDVERALCGDEYGPRRVVAHRARLCTGASCIHVPSSCEAHNRYFPAVFLPLLALNRYRIVQ